MKSAHVEIGGYLDISANMPQKDNEAYYEYALNGARFCLEYLLIERGYRSVGLPHYGCHTLREAVRRTDAEIHYYEIDRDFMPIIKENIENAPILYINYYGLMTDKCRKIAETYNNVIIDNAQAFYAHPINGADCIYSPRKFFALPDGGYIIPGTPLKKPELEIDISYDRMEHLFKRIDCGAAAAYSVSIANREILAASPMKKMSKLTRLMLSQINTQYASEKRKNNYAVLQTELSCLNEYNMVTGDNDVPLVYPFLFKNDRLRQKLNELRIFTPKYWPGMEAHTPVESYDMYLYKYMHPLSVDQRYSADDMYVIACTIKKIIKGD